MWVWLGIAMFIYFWHVKWKSAVSQWFKKVLVIFVRIFVLSYHLLIDECTLLPLHCRQDFQLSLNYGKTFIDASPDVMLSELGIVNGDILTLKTLTNMNSSSHNSDADVAASSNNEQTTEVFDKGVSSTEMGSEISHEDGTDCVEVCLWHKHSIFNKPLVVGRK